MVFAYIQTTGILQVPHAWLVCSQVAASRPDAPFLQQQLEEGTLLSTVNAQAKSHAAPVPPPLPIDCVYLCGLLSPRLTGWLCDIQSVLSPHCIASSVVSFKTFEICFSLPWFQRPSLIFQDAGE